MDQSAKTQARLDDCAKQLVDAWKTRMKREAEWERFAICARYECPVVGCQHVGHFHDNDEFLVHLTEQHPHVEEKAANMIVNDERKKWAYKPK